MAGRPAKRSKSAARRPARRLRRVSLRPLWLTWTVGALVLAVLLARFAGVFWLGAVARDLDLQLCLLAMVLGAAAALLRAWPALSACSLLVLVLGLPQLLLARSTRPTPPRGPTLRVLSAHLVAASPKPADLLTELVSRKTDVAVLTAPSSEPLAELSKQAFLRNYRVLHGAPRDGAWTMLVRRELLTSSPRAARQAGGPRVRVGACDLGLRPLHVPSLFSYGQRDARRRRLRELQALPREPRTLWLGHLGSSPAAFDVEPLLAAQEVRDGRLGHGRMPSWPPALGALGVPLEHLLVHGWLRVSTLAMGAPLAPQAHRTLRATLELTEPTCRVAP